MKIEVFSRHCIFSSISQHKERFSHFSHKACYHNLLQTFDPHKANLTFLLDVANGARADHFLFSENTYPVIEINEGTEAGSFLRLLELIEKKNFLPDTILYFVEDDYLHKPNWIDVLLEGFSLPHVDYVTLYDHRDKYFYPMYRNLSSQIFVTPSCHWRTVPSTTHTFAVRYHTLMKQIAIHRRFSQNVKISRDHEKFCFLQNIGATLISSLPGWSTHAEPKYASPCTDWEPFLTKEPSCTLSEH